MGAFIGNGQVGVWASNRERDAFLDWFADHRCGAGDSRSEFCRSEANRWTGCGINLRELIPDHEIFSITSEEYDDAAAAYWPHVAQLLGIIESISRGEWKIRVDNKAAVDWRRPEQRALWAQEPIFSQRMLKNGGGST